MKIKALLISSLATAIATSASTTLAQNRGPTDVIRHTNTVSPFHQVEPHVRRHHHDRPAPGPRDVRSLDGSGNNPADVELNATHTALARTVPEAYADGVSSLAGANRASPRDVSNAVNAQIELVPNPFDTSDYLWQWGQFVDHDIDLTEGSEPAEFAHIPITAGDPHFDPFDTGAAVIPFNRSIYDPTTGIETANPRQQLNEISGWIDGSNVYGPDADRSFALRTNDGTGRRKTSPGDLLPESNGTLPNATGGSPQVMFLAGDIRANEQLGLIAMHTLFVREDNRLADEIRESEPGLEGEALMSRIGCTGCHVQDLVIENDRRVADVDTRHDPVKGIFNRLYATAIPRFEIVADGVVHPKLLPTGESFVVEDVFTDFKRHDLGEAFHEREDDGTFQTEFLTEALWGVGTTAPYGHDGRSINLEEVILRHGGEAERSRNAFARLRANDQRKILEFLQTLVLFPPDDTASNLNPGTPGSEPQIPANHGSINLGELFQIPEEGPE